MASSNLETWPLEPAVREAVALLARGEFAALERLTGGVRLAADEIRQAVEDYPYRPHRPPPGLASPLDVIEIDTRPEAPRAWAVIVDMWTAERGLSDLSLELTVRADPAAAGGFAIEFDNLHVM